MNLAPEASFLVVVGKVIFGGGLTRVTVTILAPGGSLDVGCSSLVLSLCFVFCMASGSTVTFWFNTPVIRVLIALGCSVGDVCFCFGVGGSPLFISGPGVLVVSRRLPSLLAVPAFWACSDRRLLLLLDFLGLADLSSPELVVLSVRSLPLESVMV